MKHPFLATIGAVAFFSLSALPAIAQSSAPVPRLFGDSEHLQARIELRVERPAGVKERSARLLLRRTDDGSFKILVQIVKPSFLSGMKYLQVADVGRAPSAWLRTSQGVRALPQGGGDEPLFDSDLCAADLSIGLAGDAGSMRMLSDKDGLAVELSPDSSGNRRIAYIDPSSGLLKRLEVLDRMGAVRKVMTVLGYADAGGVAFPTRCVIENPGQSSRTILDFSEPDARSRIPESSFSKGAL